MTTTEKRRNLMNGFYHFGAAIKGFENMPQIGIANTGSTIPHADLDFLAIVFRFPK